MKHLRLALLALAFLGVVAASNMGAGSSKSEVASDGGTPFPPHRR